MTPQIPAVMGSSHIPPTGSLSLLVFFFFPPPPCPDSAFEHGQWLRHQPKSLSWNTLTCHMCRCSRTWGFPGLTRYFQWLSYTKLNLSSSVSPSDYLAFFLLLKKNNIFIINTSQCPTCFIYFVLKSTCMFRFSSEWELIWGFLAEIARFMVIL